MENPRPEKVAVVNEVKGKLGAAEAVLLTEYRGLNVAALGRLRRELKPNGGDYKIYKNNLVRFAAQASGLDTLDELLTGPTALAFVSGDVAAVAKTLRDFARTNPALVVKGGVLGGKVLSATEVSALAELPSRDVLLARLAGAFQAPLTKTAGLLAALPRNFAYGLKALIDQQGGVPADAAPAADAPPAADAAPADTAPAAESVAPAPAEDTPVADDATPTEDPTPSTDAATEE
jgi:large subunit ribosomal protein L10